MREARQLCLLVLLALCCCGQLVWCLSSFPQEGPTFQTRQPPLSTNHPCILTWKCVAKELNFQQFMKSGGVTLAAISTSDVIDPLCSVRLPAALKCLKNSPSANCTLQSSFLDLAEDFCGLKEGLKAGRPCWEAADLGKQSEPCMATFLAGHKNGDRCGPLSALRTCLDKKLRATSACSREDVGVVDTLVSGSISRFCASKGANSK